MNIRADIPAPIDPQAFRKALGCFPTGVAIVTTLDATAQPVGLTISSFNSVSMDPPLILWSLALNAGSLEAFRARGSFAINVLAADQQDLAMTFARPVDDRFAGVAWHRGRKGVPLLDGTAARFECETHACLPGGDHEIFLGHVRAHDHTERAPLVYGKGRFLEMSGESRESD